MISQKEFFQQYTHISEESFNETKLTWVLLSEIYKQYSKNVLEYKKVANYVEDNLIDINNIHSIKKRVKDPKNLIEKIIRKSIEKPECEITISNYTEIITDLIGIRILHLFKDDWEIIHNTIVENWDLLDEPVANIREGDKKDIYEEKGCKIKLHPYGYRSVHYLVLFTPSKDIQYTIEIQVRTVFEEAWSEIDHTIRYPYNVNDPILLGYLSIFNSLAGNADAMGLYIKYLQKEFQQRNQLIDELQSKIDKSSLESAEKEHLQQNLDVLKNITLKTYDDIAQDLADSQKNTSGLRDSIKGLQVNSKAVKDDKKD